MDKQYLTSQFMKEITVTVREFLRNFKKIISKNQTVIVSNHGRPEGVFVTYEEWQKRTKTTQKMSIRDALKGLTFKGGDPNLSKNIDKILYDDFNP